MLLHHRSRCVFIDLPGKGVFPHNVLVKDRGIYQGGGANEASNHLLKAVGVS